MRVAARIVTVCLAMLALTAPPAGAIALFGFNNDWAPSNVARSVGLSRKFRANSARIEVYWNGVEPRRGHYDWYALDVAYQAMARHGIQPLLDVVSAPRWAAARGCHPTYKCMQTPSHDHAYRLFLTALAKRYPRVAGIEVGQEPNLTNWSVHPDPRRYAQILKSAYTAIKHANPRTRVILGSTCCTYAGGRGNIGAGVFLSDLYRYGAKGHYDAIGFHVYPGGPIGRVGPDIVSEISIMRAIRNAHHDHSPVWITEVGFPSRGVSRYGGGRWSERTQAQRVLLAYRTITRMSDVFALYFYRLVDVRHPVAFASFEKGLGIYTTSYKPKQAARALMRARTGH